MANRDRTARREAAPMRSRDKSEVRPAADVFPMMSDEELEALGQDILENGLREPIKIMRVGKAKQIAENAFSQPTMLLDGRNRLEAMERVGIDLDSCAVKYQFVNSSRPPFTFDAVAYIISLNIRRRHLTKQQQAELIVAAVRLGKNHVKLKWFPGADAARSTRSKQRPSKLPSRPASARARSSGRSSRSTRKSVAPFPDRTRLLAGRSRPSRSLRPTQASMLLAGITWSSASTPTSISTPSRTSSSMHYARSRARGRWRDRPSTMPSSRVRDHERYSRHRHDAHRVDRRRAVE